jgi:zinc transport system substrate-binding protein
VCPRIRRVALAAAVAALVAGCSSAGEGPRVVVSMYPLEYVAERVAGDQARVENLTSPGVEPHDLELTVAQTALVAEADLAFHERGFQPAVDDAIDQAQPAHVVDGAEAVRLEAREESGGDGAGPGAAADPHFWLDPSLLTQAATAFAEAMADVDPAHEQAYRDNLASLTRDLASLDADFARGLGTCRTRTVVVSHDAFDYLGRAYDLDLLSVSGLSPGAEPSPARLGELHEAIEDAGVTTVFSEPLAGSKAADTLADDLGLVSGILDPIEGLTEETGDEDYVSLMRANLAALRKANQCE